MSRERRHRMLAGATGQAFDLAPLIDVLFLLLVFFLVATTFERRNEGLPLQLPSAESGEPVRQNAPLRIDVTADAIAVDGEPLSLTELAGRLAPAAEAKREVVIASDRRVPYERFVAVLDATRKAGIASVTLEAERRVGDRPAEPSQGPATSVLAR